ncbi:IclR family transcriptional regulator [Sporomusa acidovorans]|uniref:IclR family transcriptional regulator n=1 Tax=Sporomusa acidovorans TaxID=112900 RepID=UPI000880CCE7|nr:IclR family transcriptional regulator [Sporomusa acidovorans]OZC14795.1 HTH-type transcriptional regulator KipR [Sporomusa acidovorans DSM 3132]SDF70879.1 transcriptional regulator, IclR family [Sporomusa acidovorans]
MIDSIPKELLKNSVVKTIVILNCFSFEKPRLRIKEISSMTGISQPTVHRLLNILKQFNLVEQHEELYLLGRGFLKYEGIVLKSMEIRRISLPYMEQLANLLKINVNLAILDDNEVVFIARAENLYCTHSYYHIGMKRPIHCTAVGKVLVCKSPQIIHKLFEHGVHQYTMNTITDENVFLEEMNKIRLQGYAVDFQEWNNSINCVASPIINPAGEIVAAISISGSSNVYTVEKMENYIPHVVDYANRISSILEY